MTIFPGFPVPQYILKLKVHVLTGLKCYIKFQYTLTDQTPLTNAFIADAVATSDFCNNKTKGLKLYLHSISSILNHQLYLQPCTLCDFLKFIFAIVILKIGKFLKQI